MSVRRPGRRHSGNPPTRRKHMRGRRRMAGARTGLLLSGAALVALVVAAVGLARTATAPTIVNDPTISGSAIVGETLTGNTGTWSGTKPITYAAQWLRCVSKGESCDLISGATKTTYKLVSNDLGSTIRVRVTATNSDGSKFETSKQTAVVAQASGKPANTKPPTISGSPLVGSSLSANTGTWVGTEPITYSYQWERDLGRNGSGAGCDRRRDHAPERREVGACGRRAQGRAADRGPGAVQPQPGHVAVGADPGADQGRGHARVCRARRTRVPPLDADPHRDADRRADRHGRLDHLPRDAEVGLPAQDGVQRPVLRQGL